MKHKKTVQAINKNKTKNSSILKTSSKKFANNKNSAIMRNILIIILFMSMGIFFGVLSYTAYKTDIIQKDSVILVTVINTSVEITNYRAGLNGDIDALKFGVVPLGGGSTRYLNMTSDEDAIVNIVLSGDMAKFITVDKNDFLLSKGSSELVSFQLDVPYDVAIGKYSGVVKVTLLRNE